MAVGGSFRLTFSASCHLHFFRVSVLVFSVFFSSTACAGFTFANLFGLAAHDIFV
jgi:hypothetical protein